MSRDDDRHHQQQQQQMQSKKKSSGTADRTGAGAVSAKTSKNKNQNQNKNELSNDLELCMRACQQLYQSFDDRFSGLLSDAELRLQENNEAAKFQNMEKLLKKHVTQWYNLNRQLSQMAISARGNMNHNSVQLQTLKDEITERDQIIHSERVEKQETIAGYESQLKILESVMAIEWGLVRKIVGNGSSQTWRVITCER
jgi:hypothetical protein